MSDSIFLLCIQMVCEADANVVMAEVIPSRCLLISGLLAPASVLVVQDVVELQHEAG